MREAVAVSQSLPGPLAIQVGIFIAYLHWFLGRVGRWLGLHPAELPDRCGARGALRLLRRPQPVTAIFYGVGPAVIALILHSCCRLAKLGMEDWFQWAIAAVCLRRDHWLGAEVALLFIGAGLLGVLYYGFLFRSVSAGAPTLFVSRPSRLPMRVGGGAANFPNAGEAIGLLPKGGLADLGKRAGGCPVPRKGLVSDYGWLDGREFLVAVAVGMISPGPVVITATFVGYLVAGFWGSLVSTIGIFLPSFILVLVAAPLSCPASRQRECPGSRERGLWAAIGRFRGASCWAGSRSATG